MFLKYCKKKSSEKLVSHSQFLSNSEQLSLVQWAHNLSVLKPMHIHCVDLYITRPMMAAQMVNSFKEEYLCIVQRLSYSGILFFYYKPVILLFCFGRRI